MPLAEKSNIVLIGMPGAGKSTVGVILAKLTGKDFLDTDLLIQSAESRTLQAILDTEGHLALRAAEERVLLELDCRNTVVATGGSAAYSERAMTRLRENGTIVFLHASLPTLRRRIHNFDSRGIAKRPGQSFEELFSERFALYSRYSDLTIDIESLSQEQVAERVCLKLGM